MTKKEILAIVVGVICVVAIAACAYDIQFVQAQYVALALPEVTQIVLTHDETHTSVPDLTDGRQIVINVVTGWRAKMAAFAETVLKRHGCTTVSPNSTLSISTICTAGKAIGWGLNYDTIQFQYTPPVPKPAEKK